MDTADNPEDQEQHQELEQPAEGGQPQVLDQSEMQDVEEYSGPSPGDIVGDKRKLRVFAVNLEFDGSNAMLGEAWQDEHGNLFGTGILAIMLFEPISKAKYINASVRLDVSPLTLLCKRMSQSGFMKTVLAEEADAEE